MTHSTPAVPESIGPIQMMTLAFPGNDFRGEILPELDKLKKAGVVRIIDLLLVRKDELGQRDGDDRERPRLAGGGLLRLLVGALAGDAAAGVGRHREGRDGRCG